MDILNFTQHLNAKELFEKHQEDAKNLAKKFTRNFPKFVCRSEIENTALIALWKSALKWSPTGGTSFTTYLYTGVKYALLDYMRDNYRKKNQIKPKHISLNCPVIDDGGNKVSLADILPDKRQPHVLEIETKEEARHHLRNVREPIRGLLEDYFLNEMSIPVIARRRKLSKGYVADLLGPYRKRSGMIGYQKFLPIKPIKKETIYD